MNYFLDSEADQKTTDFKDGKAYGRVDDVEVLDEQSGSILVSYNAILKYDLHECGIQRRNNYRLNARLNSFQNNPYEKAVIFRVEIETTLKKKASKISTHSSAHMRIVGSISKYSSTVGGG